MTTPRKTKKTAAPFATAPAPARDELAERLIETGLVPNGYVLDLNGSLQVPHTMELPAPWNLPSRLFRFPIEISGQAVNGSRRIMLRHPLLAAHPFVQHVAAELAMTLDADSDRDSDTAKWWHAVDLISAGMWRDLLATAEFTTPGHIAGAVAYGLDYSNRQGANKGNGYITTAEARQIMRAIDSPEPSDRPAILRQFWKPSPCRQDSGKVAWPINEGGSADRDARAWGRIIGIEAGWFAYSRDGFLNWTEAGRDRYSAGDSITFIEASGQAAFAF